MMGESKENLKAFFWLLKWGIFWILMLLICGVPSNEIPVSAFPKIHNKLVIGLELFSYYYDRWKRITSTKNSSIEEEKKEKRRRVIETQKMIKKIRLFQEETA